MAKEAARFISEQLAELDKKHPQRVLLERALHELQAVLEIDLEEEWERQANLLFDRGFHKELGIDKGKYKDSLPRFTPQPEEYKGRFDIPLLVEGRIQAQRQYQLSGVNYRLEGLKVEDWPQDPKGFKTPDVAYATWVQDGAVKLNRSVRKVRLSLALDERGGTLLDGVSLYRANPLVEKYIYIDLPGTAVEGDRAPFLRLWGNEPMVDCNRTDDPHPKTGSLSAGRQIGTK